MPKGRRERDRPKAAPGALYNPNKRIKLSYGSESEEEAEVPQQTPVDPQGCRNKKQPTRDDPAAADQDAAPNEAGHEAEDEGLPVTNTEAPPDEQATEARGRQAAYELPAEARVSNNRTGQWHALGSLAWQHDGSDEGGEAEPDPAMEYLRSVRTERQTLPDVLSGSATQIQSRGHASKYEGFDVGEAFIGVPDAVPETEDRSHDPREVFTESIKKRFSSQRHQLHLPPSSEAVAALKDKHPISFPFSNKKAKAEWVRLLSTTGPAAAQVRSLDQETVFRLLDLIQDRYLVRQKDITRVTSAWIWALLARLDEVGLMDNDQVYNVRAFGKKAVLVLVSFRSSEAAAQLEDLTREGVATVGAAKDEEIGEDALPPTAEHDGEISDSLRENTLAMLDTILVIVGDIFRQRDLLEFRQPWEVGEDTVSRA